MKIFFSFKSSHGDQWKMSRAHQCNDCNRTFSSEKGLKKHINEAHKKTEVSKEQ